MKTYTIEDGEIKQKTLRGQEGFGTITSVTSASNFKGIIHQSFRDVARRLQNMEADFMIATGTRTYNGAPIGIPVSATPQPKMI